MLPLPTFKKGVTTNYATHETRAAREAYNAKQRAKGGAIGDAGWNSEAMPAQGFQLNQWRADHAAGRTRSRSGPGGGTGWTPQSDVMGLQARMVRGTEQHTQENYMLGTYSQAMWDKFSKWGARGPRGSTGWEETLTRNTNPQSTFAPSQMFKNEVFQTRETRKEGGALGVPFKNLPQHARRASLHPSLAYMYKESGKPKGAVRSAVRRLL